MNSVFGFRPAAAASSGFLSPAPSLAGLRIAVTAGWLIGSGLRGPVVSRIGAVGPVIPRSDFGEELFAGELGGQFVSDISLDGVQGVNVVLAGQRDGFPFGADASGTANAVDVVLGVLR